MTSKKNQPCPHDAQSPGDSGKVRVWDTWSEPCGNHCSGQSYLFLNMVLKSQFHACAFPSVYFSYLILSQYLQWKRYEIQTLSEKMLAMVKSVRFTLWWSWQWHSFNLTLGVPTRQRLSLLCEILKILQCACEYIINRTNDLVLGFLWIKMLC